MLHTSAPPCTRPKSFNERRCQRRVRLLRGLPLLLRPGGPGGGARLALARVEDVRRRPRRGHQLHVLFEVGPRKVLSVEDLLDAQPALGPNVARTVLCAHD